MTEKEPSLSDVLADKRTILAVERIRYLLTSKLTLQTQTGTYEATDILFRVERGR